MSEVTDQSTPLTTPSSPKKRASLAGDVSSQLAVQLLMRLVTGVTAIFFYRHISPADLGLLSTALAFAGFANYFTDMGFNPVLVREAAAADFERRRKLVWTSIRSRLVLTALVTSIAFVAVGLISRDPQLVFLVRVLLILTALSAMVINWVEGAMQGTEHVALAGYLRLTHASAQSLATLAVVVVGGGLTQYVIFQGVANWAIVLVSLVWILRQFPYTSHGDRSVLNGIGAFSAAGVYITFAGQLLPYGVIEQLNLLSKTLVGEYRAGATLPIMLYAIPGGIAAGMYTRMCRAWQEDHLEHTRLVLRAQQLGGVLAGLAAVGFSVGAPSVIGILFGGKYGETTIFTLSVMALVPLVQALSLPLGDAMGSSSQFGTRTWLLLVYVLFGIALCAVLPRFWGVHGTALCSIGIETILLGLYFAFTRADLRVQAARTIGVQLALALSSIVVGMIVRAPLETAVGVIPGGLIAAVVAALVYSASIIAVNQEVRDLARGLVRKVAR
jgi:O-antigen/teichoic acid export membrane protein